MTPTAAREETRCSTCAGSVPTPRKRGAGWPRGAVEPLDEVLRLDEEQRARLAEVEALRAQRNQASLAIRQQRQQARPRPKPASGHAPSPPPWPPPSLPARGGARLTQALQAIPNIPHPEVHVGHDETANRVVETHGAPTRPEWVRPHWEVGRELGIRPAGRQPAGRRALPLLIGAGAALQRAHQLAGAGRGRRLHRGCPPLLANADALTGSGHLPKFAADLFRARGPRPDSHRRGAAGEPAPWGDAGRRLAAAALRGGHALLPWGGRRARQEAHGLIRLHQFEKVERVSFTRPEESTAELARLTQAAARVLQRLAIPPRR